MKQFAAPSLRVVADVVERASRAAWPSRSTGEEAVAAITTYLEEAREDET